MRNLQNELDFIIKNLKGHKAKLLIHACCAPCCSYVLEYLKYLFDITVLYYNPNIAPLEEYQLRLNETKRLCEHFDVKFMHCDWENEKFNQLANGLEDVQEGGIRCDKCFALRLKKTAQIAKENDFEYFATSLSISPLKDAQKLCDIGEAIGNSLGIKYLPSNFKKKNGYKRSVEISNELNLYRQNYCGCIHSKKASE